MSRLIELTQGQVTQIDDEDAALLEQYTWCAMWADSSHSFYAISGKVGLLHRFLMGPTDRQVVDHANHDTLDNRRQNLRICSRRHNQQNMQMHSDNQCGCKGVSRLKTKFRARIHLNGKERSLGVFNTVEQAAMAYNAAALSNFGEFACSARRGT